MNTSPLCRPSGENRVRTSCTAQIHAEFPTPTILGDGVAWACSRVSHPLRSECVRTNAFCKISFGTHQCSLSSWTVCVLRDMMCFPKESRSERSKCTPWVEAIPIDIRWFKTLSRSAERPPRTRSWTSYWTPNA